MHHKILNFRSVGGFKTPEGIMKKDLVFRGGPLNNLDEETIHMLKDTYNIGTDIDFRTPQEIKATPDTITGMDIINLDITGDKEHVSANPLELMMDPNSNKPIELMVDLYKEIALSKNAQKLYGEFFQYLITSERNVYFHCTAGKDRTGIASAFFLKALGVSDEDIMSDYLETNKLAPILNKPTIDRIMEQYKLPPEYRVNIETLMSVNKEYLDSMFKTIDKEFGSFANYLETALNVTPDTLNKLKHRYINLD